jgi:hypothetical protein
MHGSVVKANNIKMVISDNDFHLAVREKMKSLKNVQNDKTENVANMV